MQQITQTSSHGNLSLSRGFSLFQIKQLLVIVSLIRIFHSLSIKPVEFLLSILPKWKISSFATITTIIDSPPSLSLPRFLYNEPSSMDVILRMGESLLIRLTSTNFACFALPLLYTKDPIYPPFLSFRSLAWSLRPGVGFDLLSIYLSIHVLLLSRYEIVCYRGIYVNGRKKRCQTG